MIELLKRLSRVRILSVTSTSDINADSHSGMERLLSSRSMWLMASTMGGRITDALCQLGDLLIYDTPFRHELADPPLGSFHRRPVAAVKQQTDLGRGMSCQLTAQMHCHLPYYRQGATTGAPLDLLI